MAKKKLKLECASHEEVTLLGISSTLADYRLVHYLNKQMNVSFARQEAMPYCISEGKTLSLPLYHFFHELMENNWFILANTTQKHEYMIPALRNVDYFFLVDDLIAQASKKELLKQLRRVQGIQLASPVEPSSIKNMELIYADLEMHLMELQREPRSKIPMWKRVGE